MYLSLPLPASKARPLLVTLVHADGAAPPATHALEVPKTGAAGSLLWQPSRSLSPDSNRYWDLSGYAVLQCGSLEVAFLLSQAYHDEA
jgi:hypothetical protein